MKRMVFVAVVGIGFVFSSPFARGGEGGADAPRRWWVEFTDRGRWEALSPQEIREEAMRQGLSEAALERRRIEGIPEEELVTLRDLPPDPEYLAALEETGAEVRRVSRWFNRASVIAGPAALELIAGLPFVAEVSPVGRGIMAGFQVTYGPDWDGNPPPGPGVDLPGQYGPSYLQALQVDAVEAHRLGYTGRGVPLVILDSGFELSHEAFSHLDVIAEYDFIDDDPVTGMEPGDPPNQPNHGSACLSIIAGYSPGNLVGIAPGVSVILCKTEYVPGETVQEEDDWLAGVEWAERLGARVLSSSLSYTDWYVQTDYDGVTAITSRAANRARRLGILLFTALGNEGPQPRTLGAPAEAPSVLAAGAVDSLGRIAKFSSRGPTADGRIKPDLCAMGVRTVVIKPQSNHRYVRGGGTSFATPILAGLGALLRGAHPDWSAERCARAMKATADRADRPDNVYGWGIPDIVAAIRWPELRLRARDGEGRPVAGAKVRVEPVASGTGAGESEARQDAAGGERLPREAVTGPDGLAAFPNLPEGVWRWRVLPPGGWTGADGPLEGSFTCPDGARRTVVLAAREEG